MVHLGCGLGEYPKLFYYVAHLIRFRIGVIIPTQANFSRFPSDQLVCYRTNVPGLMLIY